MRSRRFAHQAFAMNFALIACTAWQPARASTHYDAVKDFSSKENPAGVWSYNDLRLLTHRHSHYEGVMGIEGWSDDVKYDDDVTIRKNKTGHTVVLHGGNLIIPTDHLMLQDEANDDGATVQFQAPSAGVYHVRGDFLSLSPNGVAHTVYVSLNNNGLFGKRISHGHKRGFNLTVTLAVGDKLQFSSGRQIKEKPTQTGLAVKIIGP